MSFASVDVQTTEGREIGRRFGNGPYMGLVYFDRFGGDRQYVGTASAAEIRSALGELLADE